MTAAVLWCRIVSAVQKSYLTEDRGDTSPQRASLAGFLFCTAGRLDSLAMPGAITDTASEGPRPDAKPNTLIETPA